MIILVAVWTVVFFAASKSFSSENHVAQFMGICELQFVHVFTSRQNAMSVPLGERFAEDEVLRKHLLFQRVGILSETAAEVAKVNTFAYAAGVSVLTGRGVW